MSFLFFLLVSRFGFGLRAQATDRYLRKDKGMEKSNKPRPIFIQVTPSTKAAKAKTCFFSNSSNFSEKKTIETVFFCDEKSKDALFPRPAPSCKRSEMAVTVREVPESSLAGS